MKCIPENTLHGHYLIIYKCTVTHFISQKVYGLDTTSSNEVYLENIMLSFTKRQYTTGLQYDNKVREYSVPVLY